MFVWKVRQLRRNILSNFSVLLFFFNLLPLQILEDVAPVFNVFPMPWEYYRPLNCVRIYQGRHHTLGSTAPGDYNTCPCALRTWRINYGTFLLSYKEYYSIITIRIFYTELFFVKWFYFCLEFVSLLIKFEKLCVSNILMTVSD